MTVIDSRISRIYHFPHSDWRQHRHVSCRPDREFSDFYHRITASAGETWDVVAHQKRGINISAVFNMLCCHCVPVNLTRGAFKVAVNCRLQLRNAALCECGAWQGTPPGSSAAPPPVIKLARWNIGKADGAAAKIFAGCTESAERRTLFLHLFFYLFASFSPLNSLNRNTLPTPFRQRRPGWSGGRREGGWRWGQQRPQENLWSLLIDCAGYRLPSPVSMVPVNGWLKIMKAFFLFWKVQVFAFCPPCQKLIS